jgi:hypothetical protein
MDYAKNEAGQRVKAEAGAPKQALCPFCGGDVVLRSRRGYPQHDVTYFWRHRDNASLDCPTRSAYKLAMALAETAPSYSKP